jgi:anthranilate phosphoribosyltransferase
MEDPSVRPLLDTCGTGGDGLLTFNISTVAAIRGGGRGRARRQARESFHFEPVRERGCAGSAGGAHHGDAGWWRRAIRDAGIGFLFAPAFHGAMRHVQPVRLELKMSTVSIIWDR